MPQARQDLLASLYPVAKVLRRIEDDAAAEHGVTMWQYAILSVVRASPGLNQRQVAAAMQYSANRLIADVDELERAGLLTRSPGADRRANVLLVTKAGAALQRRVQAEIHKREDELLAQLAPTQQRSFAKALERLAQHARATQPPPRRRSTEGLA
jgi:DNA-binding MarR family transcriptional regulator